MQGVRQSQAGVRARGRQAGRRRRPLFPPRRRAAAQTPPAGSTSCSAWQRGTPRAARRVRGGVPRRSSACKAVGRAGRREQQQRSTAGLLACSPCVQACLGQEQHEGHRQPLLPRGHLQPQHQPVDQRGQEDAGGEGAQTGEQRLRGELRRAIKRRAWGVDEPHVRLPKGQKVPDCRHCTRGGGRGRQGGCVAAAVGRRRRHTSQVAVCAGRPTAPQMHRIPVTWSKTTASATCSVKSRHTCGSSRAGGAGRAGGAAAPIVHASILFSPECRPD